MGSIERRTNLPPTPWKAIMTNAPMIALIFAQIGHDWGFYIMVTDLPKYMDNVLRFSIKANGLYSSLPYLAMWIVSLSSGYLSDVLVNRGYIGITNARKFFTVLGEFYNLSIGSIFNITFLCSCCWTSFLHDRRIIRWL